MKLYDTARSISYYAKNGKASEEVLGWDLVLNDDNDAPVHCDLWYVFPDGQQANYTNSVPVVFAESIHTCKIVPLLADDLSSDRYPALFGSTAESHQTGDSAVLMNSGYVSRGSTRVAFQYPAGCEIVDEGNIQGRGFFVPCLETQSFLAYNGKRCLTSPFRPSYSKMNGGRLQEGLSFQPTVSEN